MTTKASLAIVFAGRGQKRAKADRNGYSLSLNGAIGSDLLLTYVPRQSSFAFAAVARVA